MPLPPPHRTGSGERRRVIQNFSGKRSCGFLMPMGARGGFRAHFRATRGREPGRAASPGTANRRQARLVRRLVAERETRLELSFGFSDVLTLSLDDQVLYRGENLFAPAVQNQGYVGLDHTVACTLAPGEHVLAAELARTEFFGWGLIVALRGDGVGLEPAAIG